jgi:hypothetical protein
MGSLCAALAMIRLIPLFWNIRLLKILLPATHCGTAVLFMKLSQNEALLALEDD